MTDFNFPHPPHEYSMVVGWAEGEHFPKVTIYIRRLEWTDAIYSRFRFDPLITCANLSEASEVAEKVKDIINSARVMAGGSATCVIGEEREMY